MTVLDTSNLSDVLDRFDNFYDGVVRRVTIESTAKVEVVIEVGDKESPSRWSMVTLSMEGCREYRLEVGRTSYEVLSSGIQVAFVDGQVLLFLEAYPEEDTLPDIKTNRAYLIGTELHWTSRFME